ncbi:Stabilin-2 [Basidiobolus ranarum]|uniref:Stabilin-2 n=1 Tax=Basidiobolus ranarum TaxID=34480 RepID=A0ABR2W6Z1_9FUNG
MRLVMEAIVAVEEPRRGGDRRGRDDWDDDRNGRGRHGRGDRDDEDDHRGRHGRHNPHRGGGRHGSDEFEKIKFPSMLGGEKLEIYLNPNSLRGNHFDIIVNNEARVVFSDYVAKNGVIHGLDNILIPKGLNVPEDWFDDEPCDF